MCVSGKLVDMIQEMEEKEKGGSRCGNWKEERIVEYL
jgi:hypothetical protein